MQNFPILKSLKNKRQLLVAITVTAGFFALNYYVMKNLPGTRDLACVIGAALTPFNITFAVVISILTGLIAAGMIDLFKQRKAAITSGSGSVLGILVGFFTIFCAACTIPFISIFGVSISLLFFSTYDLPLKILSLLLILLSIYLLNKQLRGCEKCVN